MAGGIKYVFVINIFACRNVKAIRNYKPNIACPGNL